MEANAHLLCVRLCGQVSHANGYEAEYGDPTDVMGIGEVNTFSAAVRWQASQLGGSTVPTAVHCNATDS